MKINKKALIAWVLFAMANIVDAAELQISRSGESVRIVASTLPGTTNFLLQSGGTNFTWKTNQPGVLADGATVEWREPILGGQNRYYKILVQPLPQFVGGTITHAGGVVSNTITLPFTVWAIDAAPQLAILEDIVGDTVTILDMAYISATTNGQFVIDTRRLPQLQTNYLRLLIYDNYASLDPLGTNRVGYSQPIVVVPNNAVSMPDYGKEVESQFQKTVFIHPDYATNPVSVSAWVNSGEFSNSWSGASQAVGNPREIWDANTNYDGYLGTTCTVRVVVFTSLRPLEKFTNIFSIPIRRVPLAYGCISGFETGQLADPFETLTAADRALVRMIAYGDHFNLADSTWEFNSSVNEIGSEDWENYIHLLNGGFTIAPTHFYLWAKLGAGGSPKFPLDAFNGPSKPTFGFFDGSFPAGLVYKLFGREKFSLEEVYNRGMIPRCAIYQVKPIPGEEAAVDITADHRLLVDRFFTRAFQKGGNPMPTNTVATAWAYAAKRNNGSPNPVAACYDMAGCTNMPVLMVTGAYPEWWFQDTNAMTSVQGGTK